MIAEELEIKTISVEKGRVVVRKSVSEKGVSLEGKRRVEEYEIERVPVDKPVDQAVPVRQEGDTTVIGVFQEEPKVVMQLVLKEELRVKKTVREEIVPFQEKSRQDVVSVERFDGDNQRSGRNE